MAGRPPGATVSSVWREVWAVFAATLAIGAEACVPCAEPQVAPQVEFMVGPKVELLILGEAGCPFCQRAIRFIDEVMKAPGIADIIELVYRPFGNNFYATEACGYAPYAPSKRRCWAGMCVGVNNPPCQCFVGTVVSQHGAAEAEVNRVEACAKKLAGDWHRFWPFLVCMEQEFDRQGLAASAHCAAQAQLDNAALQACSEGADGEEALALEARGTFDHETVPYIAVEGQQIWLEEVLDKVCAAYTGSKPAGCPPPAPEGSNPFWWAPRWQ